MGRWMQGEDWEKISDVHLVVMTPFHMAATEVTQGQWRAVMGGLPHDQETEPFLSDRFPVTNIAWPEAMEFCHRLSVLHRQEGKIPASMGYELPTIRQWEYAALAGQGGEPEGTGLDAVAWYYKDDDTASEPREVGMKKANPWGVYDMQGNVWEWCRDRFATIPETKDWAWKDLVAIKGGSAGADPEACRIGVIEGIPPSGYKSVGFRPVLLPLLTVMERWSIRWDDKGCYAEFQIGGRQEDFTFPLQPQGGGSVELLDCEQMSGNPETYRLRYIAGEVGTSDRVLAERIALLQWLEDEETPTLLSDQPLAWRSIDRNRLHARE